jgi:hypothetical protein
MSKTQIDGSGLLLAALAALLALSVLAGPFAWLGSIAGLILVFVLLAYDREGYRSGLESLAFSAVFALCLTIASGTFWRYVAASQNRPNSFEGVVANDWLPLFWLGLTLLFVPIDRARMSGRVQQPTYTPASPHAPAGFIPRTPAPAPPPQPFTPPPPAPAPAPEPVRIVAPPPPPPPAPPPPAPAAPPSSFSRPTFSQPIAPEPPPLFTSHVAPAPEPVPRPIPPPPPPPAAAAPVAAPEPPPFAIAPIPPGREATIYVTLIEEGLNVLRAVRAENLGHDFYRIAEEMPPGETWQYGPNQVVRCKKKNLSSGKAMVAIEEAPRAN